MRYALLLHLCGLLALSEAAWVRVWEDDFDWNGRVNLSKWKFDVGGSGWGRICRAPPIIFVRFISFDKC